MPCPCSLTTHDSRCWEEFVETSASSDEAFARVDDDDRVLLELWLDHFGRGRGGRDLSVIGHLS